MPTIALPHPPRRILLVKPSALGDVVHALPVLHLLKRRFPAARIDWFVGTAFAPLLDNHPDLSGVVPFERKSPRSVPDLARRLGETGYDLAVDLQGLFRSGWLTGQTRAVTRVGFSYAREGAAVFYTHKVAPAPGHGDDDRHAVERYLDVAEALGCGRGPVEFDFAVAGDDRDAVASMLAPLGPDRPFAVLLPGTNWATKRWPIESFDALVKPLRDRFGLSSVVAGAGDAGPLAGALDLTGRTSLKQLVALLERASLVVSNDSGPMHVAAALGRPLVALFGPTNPDRTGPHRRPECVLRLDLPCSPCYSRRCVHQSCLQWLPPSAVLDAAARQLTT